MSVLRGLVRYGGRIVNGGADYRFANGLEMGHFLTRDFQSGKDEWPGAARIPGPRGDCACA